MIEKTLVLLKPDAVLRGLIGRILQRFEDSGLKVIGMKMVNVDKDLAGKHYGEDIAEKHGENVRNRLINYVVESPILALVLEGVSAISIVRKIVGSTYPNDSLPGTIRGDFAHISQRYALDNDVDVKNLVHASSDVEDAEKEVGLWFGDAELHDYKTVHEVHMK